MNIKFLENNFNLSSGKIFYNLEGIELGEGD
jgi:hypothetical protein